MHKDFDRKIKPNLNVSFKNKKHANLILEKADEEDMSSDEGADSEDEANRRIVLGN